MKHIINSKVDENCTEAFLKSKNNYDFVNALLAEFSVRAPGNNKLLQTILTSLSEVPHTTRHFKQSDYTAKLQP